MKKILSHKGSIKWVFLFGIVLVALTITTISIAISSLRQEAIQTKRHIASLHSNTFEENFSALLHQTEQIMEKIPFLSDGKTSQKELNSIFNNVLQNAPYIRSISLLNTRSKIIASSSKNNIGVHIAFDGFFPKPFEDTAILQIGRPWEGRDFSNAKESSTATPITLDAIHFLPILKKIYFHMKAYYIIVNINTDYLLNNYLNILPFNVGNLNFYRSDAILLLSTDRTLHVGSSHYTKTHNQSRSEHSFFDHMKKGEHKLIESIKESVSLPFVVQVVLDEKQALGYWDNERNKVLWLSGSLIGLCGSLGFLLFFKYYRELVRQRDQLSYEKQFRIAMEATQTGLWKWNFITDEITWDTQCYLTLGYKPNAFHPTLEKIRELTHPEESENMLKTIKEQIASSGEFLLERRMHAAYGNWVWIQVRGKVIEYTQNNEPHLLTGVYINIDKQKKAEHLHLNAVAFETQEAILITDIDEKIIKVNEAFTQITGYSEDEVLGKTPRIFASGEHNEDFYKQMWQSLKKESFYRAEVWNKRKNGELYAEFLTITAIRNEKNIITHYLANFNDITTHKMAQKHINELAYYDPLTRLANRRLLEKSLDKVINTSKKENHFCAVVFIDLDNFKELNDTYGHDSGDMILIQTANRLLDATRKSDTVARLGGDEFIVLLENLGSIEDEKTANILAHDICKKIHSRLNEPYSLSFGNYLLGASIGYSIFSGKTSKDQAALLKEADIAMYNSKKAGRNKISSFQNLYR